MTTKLLPQDEEAFQAWYAKIAKENHLDPNVDAPEHHYDMRGAYNAGHRGTLSAEDNRLHFPSEFKSDDHPNRFVPTGNGTWDTKYGVLQGYATGGMTPPQTSPQMQPTPAGGSPMAPPQMPAEGAPQQPPQAQPMQMPPPKPNLPGMHPMNAPTPGQSLTKEPGNSVWEHPPKYTDVHSAVSFVFDQLVKPKNTYQMLAMLEKGVTVEQILRLILFAGFSEGKWTPDLAMLMARPVMMVIAGIAHRAGVKGKLTSVDRSGFKDLMNIQKMPQVNSSAPTAPMKLPKAITKGLMSPR